MALLRDARTSEVVFEGTPLECILAAQDLGGASVAPQLDEGTEDHGLGTELVYDDVGLGFDPDAVLKVAQENIAGLAGAAADHENSAAERKRLAKAHEQAKAAMRVDRQDISAAERALEEARRAQDEALAAGG